MRDLRKQSKENSKMRRNQDGQQQQSHRGGGGGGGGRGGVLCVNEFIWIAAFPPQIVQCESFYVFMKSFPLHKQ
jgi:hypothetical protein